MSKINARSRIDRIYMTETEGGKIQNTNFYKTPGDDHKIYKINIFDNTDIGPGQWELKVNLLKDPTVMKTFKKEWIEFRKMPPLCFSFICGLITTKLCMMVLWDKIS